MISNYIIKVIRILLISLVLLNLTIPLPIKADGGLVSPFDYFVYETYQKAVIVYEEGMETLILSITFRGDAKDFGWVVPTPTKPEVDKSSDELFTSLEELTRPEAAYRTENILGIPQTTKKEEAVTVVETKKIDIYNITVLEATDPNALAKWLDKNGYQFPTDSAYILEDYVEKGWFFVACKIRPEFAGGQTS